MAAFICSNTNLDIVGVLGSQIKDCSSLHDRLDMETVSGSRCLLRWATVVLVGRRD